MLSRRSLTLGLGLSVFADKAIRADDPRSALVADFQRIADGIGGRLGVAVRGPFGQVALRGDERIPLCSTFKLLAAAAILKRVDEGRESVDRRIVFDAGDVVDGSPITSTRAGGDGMSLAELCEAAITRSDNTAGNLMLRAIGGPPGVTAFARRIGDDTTRLDRTEPDLNESAPGDLRDTTTPIAMLGNLQALALGDVLAPKSREQLCAWLVANKTGDSRLRAGFPPGWRVGDKTGTGENGSAGDVAIVWPPGRPPLLIAAYVTGTSASLERRNEAFAAIGKCVAAYI